MGFGLGDIIGGIASAGVSAYGQRQQLKWEREKAQNAHQWEVQDLIKAGLNPILSAGGQGASAGSIGGIDGSSISSGFSSAMQRKIEKQRLELEKLKGKAEIKNINAQTENANANTARTLALTPEEVETHRFNRSGRLNRELGTKASAKAQEMIENMGTQAGKWYGEKTTKHYEPKPKWKPQPLIFRDNKHSYMR